MSDTRWDTRWYKRDKGRETRETRGPRETRGRFCCLIKLIRVLENQKTNNKQHREGLLNISPQDKNNKRMKKL